MPGVTYLACDPVKRLDSEREAATIHSVNQERSAGARAAPGPGRSGRWRKVEPGGAVERAERLLRKLRVLAPPPAGAPSSSHPSVRSQG